MERSYPIIRRIVEDHSKFIRRFAQFRFIAGIDGLSDLFSLAKRFYGPFFVWDHQQNASSFTQQFGPFLLVAGADQGFGLIQHRERAGDSVFLGFKQRQAPHECARGHWECFFAKVDGQAQELAGIF